MHRKASMLCVLAALLCFGSVAFAQEQTVSIQGVVKDASGAVLPGATVEARNPLAGTNTAVTNADGVYRFPALPPGKYEITATLQGFKSAKLTDTVLELGRNLVIDLTMALASVTEEVSVTAESSPIIDVKGNAATASITRNTIERMPKGRDFTTILRQAPGAQAESKAGGTQIDGASGSENRFILDGMDTTNLQTGVSGKTMLLDFVEEVQVKSSGYNAEFGGATGGVVNVLTKSGTNAFHGQAGTYYQTEDDVRKYPAAGAVQPDRQQSRRDGDDHARQQLDVLQPGCGYRRPAAPRSPVVLRRRRVYQERELERCDLPHRRQQDEASLRILGRREVLQLQPHGPALEQSPRQVLRLQPAQCQPRHAAGAAAGQRACPSRRTPCIRTACRAPGCR